MDFAALIGVANSAVGQIVLSIAAMAVGWFGPRVAIWAYDTVMGMLDGGSSRSERSEGRTVDWGDGSFTHMTDQEYEDYEYHRQRDESRWS